MSFLTLVCREGIRYLVILRHIFFKGIKGLLWFHWIYISINIINDTVKDVLIYICNVVDFLQVVSNLYLSKK